MAGVFELAGDDVDSCLLRFEVGFLEDFGCGGEDGAVGVWDSVLVGEDAEGDVCGV